jgi:hypothetical protein
MTEQKTKILINRLSRLWKEIGLDERKKYGNFETFVKHKIETEPFSVRGELERFLIKWLAQPEVQNDFGNDFEAYVHFMLNEKNVES